MATLAESLLTDITHISDLERTASGDLGTLSGLANVKNRLFHRLMTVPGSLIHRPTYGVGITAYANAASSLTIYQALATRIQQQFKLDPAVTDVKRVLIQPDDSNAAKTVVQVSVNIDGYGEAQMNFIPFSDGV